MRRPKAADIPATVILAACARFHAGEDRRTPDVALADAWPAKVILAKMEKLEGRGLIECGVSLRTAWLTDAGRAFLAGAPAPTPSPRPRS